jgi:predicted RNA-binding Zn-ribbon protein involved in translation (DUF1610 family)
MMFKESHGEKYPAIIVQSTITAASILYLSEGGKSIPILVSLTIVLSLFVFQAFSKRFRYDFPFNQFMMVQTRDVDTYALYGLTFLSVLFFMWGVLDSILWSIVSALAITVPGYFWGKKGQPWISNRVTNKLLGIGRKDVTQIVPQEICPNCGSQMSLVRSVIDSRRGEQVKTCLNPECGYVITENVIFSRPIGY